MKNFIFIIVFIFSISTFSQNQENTVNVNTIENSIIEDFNGKIITDSLQRIAFFKMRQDEVDLNSKNKMPFSKLQPAVHLCSNGNFEEFEAVAGNNVLKNFQYITGRPSSPMQCKSLNVTADQYINQYNPSSNNLMATTVPSNYIDNYIGNLGGFDQYLLKINHQNSGITSSIVQAKRFKTNNENNVVFNFKAVLQSISGSGHLNEQPYFKGRILNRNGVVVDEFCLIGDPANCIFTEAGNGQYGDIILYTQNWQTGNLDISSIPNNEEFTIEFTGSRCGLGGHFGYAYVDDICLVHTDENLQGSITLDPLYEICPTLPISVCGTFTIPNSGGVAATVNSVSIKVYNELNVLVYTSSSPVTLDIVNKTFCFELNNGNLPNTTTGSYNISANINYGITQTTSCAGLNFAIATDNDANPGWDISFLNCNPNCSYSISPATLTLCDTNSDGKEFFNLTETESTIIGTQTGLTFSYYRTLLDATNDTNAITLTTNYESYTTTIFVRVITDATCYKIIAIQLVVRNPSTTISGILNVCSGSTVLTASPGASHLWSTGETTENITVTSTGTYTVTVTDSFGCISNSSVTIIPNQVAVLPTIIITQPDCFNSYGIIEVTSPASEYSYDGGITWTTNSIANNLGVGNYNVKIRTITGCESYNSLVNIRPFLSSSPYISITQPTSCGAYGKITVNTTSSEFSFDDGLTWSTNNVADNLSIGIYLIRVKDSNGCISNPRAASIYGVFLSPPQYTLINPFCSSLGSITITTTADEYSFDGGNTWQASNFKDNLSSGTYILQIRNNLGCTSPNVYVNLNKFESTYPTYTITPAGCDQYATLTINTVGNEFSFDGGLTWSTTNVLPNLNGGTTIPIKVRRAGNCSSLTANVFISSYYLPLPIVTNFSTLICDNLNNNTEVVNLMSFNSQLIINPNNYNYTYYHTLLGAQNQTSTELITNSSSYNLNEPNKIFYVRITDANTCSSIALLDLTLILTPVIVLEDTYYLCENNTVLVSEDSSHETYLWSNGSTNSSIVISQPGNYTLTVTKTNGIVICTTVKNFKVVLSNPATITALIPTDWTPIDNTITVNTTGLGTYEYSLNGIDYQDSPIFTNLENGEYTVYVRDKNGCGVNTDYIYLLMHPKYFTPNGDGINDFWKIKFSENEPNLTVKIFDRYGKFIKQIGPNSNGWDGTYLGVNAIASDYWFVVIRENGKEHRGHFSLIR